MTTIRDLLNDLVTEAKKIPAKIKEEQQMALDDNMRSAEEIDEELTSELVEEYLDILVRRIVG